MWNQPYLETCCRSALHRLKLAGPDGRPLSVAELKDGRCLHRLCDLGLAATDDGARVRVTEAGLARHRQEIGGGGRAVA